MIIQTWQDYVSATRMEITCDATKSLFPCNDKIIDNKTVLFNTVKNGGKQNEKRVCRKRRSFDYLYR